MYTQAKLRPGRKRGLATEHMTSLHDPWGLLRSVGWGDKASSKRQRLVYNSGQSTDLRVVWVTELAKTQPLSFREVGVTETHE